MEGRQDMTAGTVVVTGEGGEKRGLPRKRKVGMEGKERDRE